MKSLAPAGVDCRIGHVALGTASGLLPGILAAGLSLGFSAYEMARSKPEKKKLEALAEFGVGYLIGTVVKEIG